MKTNIALCILILAAAILAGGAEAGLAALALGAVVTTLVFSFAKGIPKTEAVMAQGDVAEDTIKVEALGGKAELRGPNIVARTIGSNTTTNILLFVLAAGLYYHDAGTSAVQQRLAKAVEVSNYINLQPEEKRLEIGRKMAEPQALRDLYR